MCGLVGYMGDSSRKIFDVFKNMLVVDAVRGNDSVGVAAISRGGVKILKDTILPQDLIDTREYSNIVENFGNVCVMGHNRFATKGFVNKDNAHPFQVGDIVLAHNGTLENQWELPKGMSFKTDSEALCNSIDELGLEATWKKFRGAAAISMWDIRERELTLMTNGKRPLFVGACPENKGLFWSSEQWTYRMMAARNGVHIDKHFVLEPDKGFIVRFTNKACTKIEWTVKQYDPFVTPPSSSMSISTTTGGKDLITSGAAQTGNKGGKDVTNVLSFPRQVPNVGQVMAQNRQEEQRIQDPYTRTDVKDKGTMTKGAFHARYKKCMFCEDKFNQKTDFETSVVIDEYRALCSDCFKMAETENIIIE